MAPPRSVGKEEHSAAVLPETPAPKLCKTSHKPNATTVCGVETYGKKNGPDWALGAVKLWLPGQDSNLEWEDQNLLCCRYTTG